MERAEGELFTPRRRLFPVSAAAPRRRGTLIVLRAVPAYVTWMRVQESVMSQPAASPKPRFSRLLAVAAVVAAIMLAGTVGLWAHYGTAVFYETILAGIAACL